MLTSIIDLRTWIQLVFYGVHVAQYLVSCVMFCPPLSALFLIVFSVLLWCTSSNYIYGIFKLFYVKFWPVNMKKFISVWIFIKKTILIFIISHSSHLGQVLRPWLWKRITQLNFEKQSEGQEAFVFQLKHM